MGKQTSLHQLMIWWGFHFLTTINNAAVNIHLQVFIWTHVFSSLGYVARSEVLGHRPRFNILRNRQTVFPMWLHHLALPPAVYGDSSFFMSSPTLVTVCLLYYNSPSGCEWYCGVDLYFINDSDVEHLSLCLLLLQLFLLNLNYISLFFFLVLFIEI